LDFEEEYLRQKLMHQYDSMNEMQLSEAVEAEKNKVKRNMPLKIKLSRNYRTNKELIEIESIKDRERDELSDRLLNLSLMTLPDETGYWLDTGAFVLNIK